MAKNHQHAAIALNRFGYGGSGEELQLAAGNPKAYLKHGLTPVVFNDELPDSNTLMSKAGELIKQYRQAKKSGQSEEQLKQLRQQRQRLSRQSFQKVSVSSITGAVHSTNTINWRLLDFFSNHFSVTGQGPVMLILAPTLEREAIANNLFGRFEDLLIAVVQHPAMLIYLNNEQSFGKNSQAGKRGRGLNENLAREILELHTLGVDGPYNQQDVIELAKAITGWSVGAVQRDEQPGFLFRSFGHEPGSRRLLDKTYKQQGIKQGLAMLKDLANHPTTAQYICHKMVKHFIMDKPEPKLVDAMVNTWMASRGDIKSVVATMIDSDYSWQPQRQKFKTPRDYVISTLRTLGLNQYKEKQLSYTMRELGQLPFKAGSPAGYSDEQADWDGSSALVAKIDWVSMLVAKVDVSAMDIINNNLALANTSLTYNMVSRSESRDQALALALLSPEFMRR
ncbi:DUF1800 domain-containing protein [Thalassotalea sp. HSM 43]|uniref:DUF1800 domain-containing protein n=1 Tax=Thalassotalea sp. HSM 43 TaxID=2552945 RepID=UPI0010812BBA|nr:DUF1800 domain-containing protein [Thalassotalea sp. HSM 43]QBY04259.1 DUF1800 domain-containing protein [Thalassotalea sp. HSM 43]